MKRFRQANNIAGWLVFIIAILVYSLTVEPTASYWDCGEFIAASFKLEVPHPPGAPLFLLLGRMFSFLAGGNVQEVAYWINHISVIASAFTILFLFWSVTMLIRKIPGFNAPEPDPSKKWMILSAGVIGSLVYAFSDSFWFSAVEAEVYAMSSFFTAFVFWAILKWDRITDDRDANRWLVLIFFMMGLSIGVHLLNLVTIPALALIYYFRKYKPTRRGVAIALTAGVAGILFISNFVIQGLPTLAGKFEIFFVNVFGMPFYSGVLIFAVLFFGLVIYGLYLTQKKGMVVANTFFLCFVFVLIGYSSFTAAVIRSNYHPPINEDNPDNILSIVSYLKRDQYGSWPIAYGPYFDAGVVEQKKGAPVYVRGNDRYKVSYHRLENVYDPNRETILPRAWSTASGKPEGYRNWMGLGPKQNPDFIDNIKFMLEYQVGYMYMRYFMWNFAGRASDVQGAGWLRPWQTSKGLPELLKNNRGRNNYFMVPLILGILGLLYSYKRNRKIFSVLSVLFIFTGLALVIYLNSPPSEPRERDYIYLGSFYVFSIWIGLGVLAFMEFMGRILRHNTAGIVAGLLICTAAPMLIATSNWDDHDRSNRYFSVDSAKNFLSSCPPNAILFTGGDNDTFPLWYAQEVEGYRTDVRVIVLSYFNTDWYIDQMTRQAYQSAPLPISLTHDQYRQGGLNDYLPFVENPNLKGKMVSLKAYLGLLKENYKNIQVETPFGSLNTLPVRSLYLNIDKDDIIARKILPLNILQQVDDQHPARELSNQPVAENSENEVAIPDKMVFTIKNNGIYKNTLITLDIIANSNWSRPVCFSQTALMNLDVDLTPYMVREGNVYQLMPVQRESLQEDLVDTDTMYNNVMNKFVFRELDNPEVYYNEDYRNFVLNHRNTFNALAMGLIREGRMEDARKVLDRSLKVMPDDTVPYDVTTPKTALLLNALGEKQESTEIGKVLSRRSLEFLNYLVKTHVGSGLEVNSNLYILNQMVNLFKNAGDNEYASGLEKKFMNYYKHFYGN